jgi:type I restriction enzyme S subunit
MFFRLPVILPPYLEQQKIMDSVAAQTERLTIAIDRYEREITLLREYRTRLVADLVTGKLDVREMALSLPEEDVALASEDAEDEAEEPEMEECED